MQLGCGTGRWWFCFRTTAKVWGSTANRATATSFTKHVAGAAHPALAVRGRGHAARVTEPAGLIDVAPTILESLRLPVPPSFEGTSLLATHGAVYGESLHAHDAFGWAPLRSLRAGAYKYVAAPRPELYNLGTDPREQHNLFVKGLPKALELEGQLAKLLARYAAKRPASPAMPRHKRERCSIRSAISPPDRAPRWALGSGSQGPAAGIPAL